MWVWPTYYMHKRGNPLDSTFHCIYWESQTGCIFAFLLFFATQARDFEFAGAVVLRL